MKGKVSEAYKYQLYIVLNFELSLLLYYVIIIKYF